MILSEKGRDSKMEGLRVRKYLIRCTALVMAMLLLIAGGAMAEVELTRGDRSNDVFELQQLLFENGWLFELPDGVFGKNTEAAVKAFEEYAGLPVDGIADELMIYNLAVAVEDLNNKNGVVSSYFGESPVEYFIEKFGWYADDPENGGMDFGECCTQWTDLAGSSGVDYCEAHYNLYVDTFYMLECFEAEAARQASDLWYEEVNRLYDVWAELLPEEERGGVVANKATFLASIEAQRMAANIGTPSEMKIVESEAGICQSLCNQAVWLCGTIWQLENGGEESEASNADEAIRLNESVIIEGELIYYSGNIAGQGEGIYVMYRDGSDLMKLSDISATLEAVSNGNLLVWHYDDNGYAMLEVLRSDGTLERVAYDYNGRAIAHDGRFYYGGSSVDEKGGDHQWLLTSDPEYHECFWPLAVEDGCLYYMDSYGAENDYNLRGVIPVEATLNRLNLETGDVELLSGAGTKLIGIEDGVAYYTRENFMVYTDDGGMFEMEVDQGLFHMNLEVLAETKLAELGESDMVFDYYTMVRDGVIYGERFDYETETGAYRIIRVTSGGEMLDAVSLEEGKSMAGCCVAGEWYFGTSMNGYDVGEELVYRDVIKGVNVNTGEIIAIELPQGETVNFGETDAKVAVVDGEIYYYVYNETDEAFSLKVMNMDGSNTRTLIQEAPMNWN